MTERGFSDYVRAFYYDERVDIKIQLPVMLKLYRENKVQIIDIRFHEEYEAWKTGIGIHIPLSEIPDRLDEIEIEKTIVAMCPPYDEPKSPAST